MAEKNWVLIGDEAATQDELVIEPAKVGGRASGYRVHARTLHGGLREGVRSVRIDNGKLAVEVLPTRGMSLWKAWQDGEAIGWNSPVRGPVHPQFVPVTEPGGLGWLDGFDELLVRCGLESNGAPEFDDDGRLAYPLHGRIGNKPAHHVELAVDGDTGTITLIGVVEETRFHFIKLRMTSKLVTKVNEPSLTIEDTIENLSAGDAEMQMLYHVNFGEPLLDAGSRFVAPVEEVVPRNAHAASQVSSWDSYAAPQTGYEEQVYFLKLQGDGQNNSRAMLRNAHGTRAVELRFPLKQLPCFTVWKNTTASEDGCVTGLEPGTNFPNPRTFEGSQDRVVKLAGRQSVSFQLQLLVHQGADQVRRAEQTIAQLQTGDAKVHSTPQPSWCADA